MLGRDFVAQDAEKGAATVVLLSYEGWQTFFQGNPHVVGQTLRIGGEPSTVIGVLPPGMRFPRIALAPKIAFQEAAGTLETTIFLPLVPSDWDLKKDLGNFNYKVIARLKPGVTLAQASAELEGLQQAYTISARLPVRLGIALTPLASDVTSGISGALWLMFAAVGGVLLIACVNLANLQLARSVAAERETAVRAALGASRGQLVMARLAESLVLALAGGVAGVMLAFSGVRLLVALAPGNVPRLNEVQVNLPVLLFAAGAVDCRGNVVRHSARAALASRGPPGSVAGKFVAGCQYSRGPPHAKPAGGNGGGLHRRPADHHFPGAAEFLPPIAAESRI